MIPCFHMHTAFVRRRYLFCTLRLHLHKKNKFEIQSSNSKRNLHKMHLGHVLVWRGVVKRNDDINKKCFQCSVVTSCFRVAARSCVPSLRLRHSRQREYLLLLLTWDKKIFCSDKNVILRYCWSTLDIHNLVTSLEQSKGRDFLQYPWYFFELFFVTFGQWSLVIFFRLHFQE